MPEEELQPNKSTRSFEEWTLALRSLILNRDPSNVKVVDFDLEKIKPYYDQGLMPDVCFKELFNR